MKISEQDLLILAETYHVQSHDKTSSLIQFCEELIALAQSDLVERIKTLQFPEHRKNRSAGAVSAFHHAKELIIELIEGAKCTTQKD